MIYNKGIKLSALGIALTTAVGGTISTIVVAAEGKKIEVIQVTAQKRSQSINEVPMAISAFNKDMLSEMGIEDTADLANVVPGFNFSETAFGPPVYTLRGVGFNASSPQATSTVGVYVDEIAVPFPIMTKAVMMDIERVEVLKGPQGTLYGRNSTGGAINYIAAKPSDNFEAGFIGSLSSFETFSAEGFITGSVSDNINARLAIKKVDSGEGWQESITRDESLGRQDKFASRLSLDITLGAETQALFTSSYSTDKSESVAPQATRYDSRRPCEGPGSDHPIAAVSRYSCDNFTSETMTGYSDDPTKADWTKGANPHVEHENLSLTLNITHNITDTMTFTSLTGYSDFTDDGSEYERSGFEGVRAGWVRNDSPEANEPFLKGWWADVSDDTHVTTDYVYQNGTIDSWSQEFRIGETLDNVVWLAGVYYSESSVIYDTTQDWGLASNILLTTSGVGFSQATNSIEQDTTSVAVFANADWTLSDSLILTTGIRYADNKAEYNGCTQDNGDGDMVGALALVSAAFGGTAAGFPPGGYVDVLQPGDCITLLDTDNSGDFSDADRPGRIESTLNEDSLSWRLALNYDMGNNSSIYGSYSRGFKAGSFPSLAAVSFKQLQPVVQEQLDAFELGYKASLLESTMQLNLSAFYYDYTDKQLLTKEEHPIFRTVFTQSNVDKSSVTGLEADIMWLPTDNLTLTFAASYLDTEIKKGFEFNQLGQYIDIAGSPLPFAADFSANLTAKYEWDISESMSGLAAFDVAYTGESHHDFESSAATYDLFQVFGAVDTHPYEFDETFIGDVYTVANARFGVESTEGDWKVYAWVRNLTDEWYATSTVKNNEMIARYSAMGRSAGVTFEYNWF